jgi:hypothetical protein
MFRANHPEGLQTEQQEQQPGRQQGQEQEQSPQSRRSWTGELEEQPLLASAVASAAVGEGQRQGQERTFGRALLKQRRWEQHWRQTSACPRICLG